jgi:hypothetical protein
MVEQQLFKVACPILLFLLVSGCAHFGNSHAGKDLTGPHRKGEYGYDAAFLGKALVFIK